VKDLIKNVANRKSKDKLVPYNGCDPSQVQQVIVKGTKLLNKSDTPLNFLQRIESLQKLGVENDNNFDS
jgi:hypothetical protein